MRVFIILLLTITITAKAQQTVFEKSNGTESATYFEAIDYYKKLDKESSQILMETMGPTDAGYPLHLVLISADGNFDPALWHAKNKTVVLVINGIHPGEPDGIDASMMLARDMINGRLKQPGNVCFAIIPVYNIGGCLNRSSTSRANQNGPKEYGFRGNSQNLDLNRDFTKCDSREAQSFAQIFHWLDPDIQIDNHVSDGADYQYTMTMLTTQPDKLGGELGQWLKNNFGPSLNAGMANKHWDMSPYVNFEETDFKTGMDAFYDSPRYSSGYAALFQTIAFVPETHMLKPFKNRVLATYAFMQTIMEEGSRQSNELIALRKKARAAIATSTRFPLSWQKDTTQYSNIHFKGYERDSAVSEATGLKKMFYNHQKPFDRLIPYYNNFLPAQFVDAPKYYVIPQGWHAVTDLLKWNDVKMLPLEKDTIIKVQSIKIKSYKTASTPYEKHYRKSDIQFDTLQQQVRFLKGDLLIPVNQPANRFIVEMLEPAGADSYFSWNFFDGVLQQKEGYSDYRWDDVAATVLKSDTALQTMLNEKRKSDTAFAKDASAQLDFIYKHSAYYEPGHMRLPVYWIK